MLDLIPNEINENIFKFLKKKEFFNIFLTNKNFYLFNIIDNIWKHIIYNEKGKMFYKIANMRSENVYFPKCDYHESHKSQLENIYNFENEHQRNVKNNEYYQLWILNEFIHKKKYDLALKMIKELIEYFKLKNTNNLNRYWKQKDNELKSFEFYLSKNSNLNYYKKSKIFLNNLISFLELDL